MRRRRHGGGEVFFFNDTATTEIYTLSLHDALPICDANLFANFVGFGWANAMNVTQRDWNALIRRYIEIGRAHV